MAITFTYIAETVIATPQSTITFSSIPQTYRHLCLFMSPRSDTTAGSRDLTIVLNGQSGTLQGMNYMGSDAGSAFASSAPNRSDLLVNDSVPGTDYTANLFGGTEFWIYDYSKSDRIKLPIDITTNRNVASNAGRITSHTHYWGYNDAVTGIVITCQGGWETNSTARLYGINSA